MSGLEFEILHKFEDGHTLAVNCLCSSWAHLITGGDDGVLNIYNLYSDYDWGKSREKRLEVNGAIPALLKHRTAIALTLNSQDACGVSLLRMRMTSSKMWHSSSLEQTKANYRLSA